MNSIPPTNRRHAVTWFILTAVYAGMAWQGLAGGLRDMGVSEDLPERITSAGEILFGAGALVATVARLAGVVLTGLGRAMDVWPVAWWGAVAWAVGTLIAGGTAPMTFGGTGIGPAAASAVSVVLICAGVLWLDRWSWKGRAVRPRTSSSA